jgi:hypothetical protein
MNEMELVRQKVYQLEQQQIQIKQKWVAIPLGHWAAILCDVVERYIKTFLTTSNIDMMMRLPVYIGNSPKTVVCNPSHLMSVVLPTARDPRRVLNHR